MADLIKEWRSPSPLWPAILGRNGSAGATTLAQPSILRFASDSFMEEFLAVLERDPSQLEAFVAQPETWRKPTPVPARTKALFQPKGPLSVAARRRAVARRGAGGGAAPSAEAETEPGPLKLYHPAHQRYYLVTSSLVCRTVGLPDRKVSPGKDERASFIVRRLLPPDGTTAAAEASPQDLATWEEHAFLATADGYAWEKVGSAADGTAARILPHEERSRLFGAGFTGAQGLDRRLFAGVVPVGARETYLGAPLREAASGLDGDGGGGAQAAVAAPPDPRLTMFRIQVLEPWRALIAQASVAADQAKASESHPEFGVPGSVSAARANALDLVREQIQTGSWYILLDLADFLKSELPGTWQQVKTPPATAPAAGTLLHALNLPVPLPTPRAKFLSRTDQYTAGQIKPTLAAALRAVTAAGVGTRLESVVTPYDRQAPDPNWPSFLFPLADPEQGGTHPTDENTITFGNLRAKVNQLETLIEQALAASPKDLPQPATALLTQSAFDLRDGWFVIRCVFERPNCGKLEPPVVSAPTKPFQLAAFFDPDAPARAIRIALPADTTPAGLRKFAKNTVFQFSDILCGQVDALKKITFGDLVLSVLPWPFHKDLDLKDVGVCKDKGSAAGMACSLSIPIVTICALILLIMIVTILDYIFRWIPWFIACFRIPGLSGKNA